jgi:hypothetical protein
MAALLKKEKLMSESLPLNPGTPVEQAAEQLILQFATNMSSTLATLTSTVSKLMELTIRLDAKIDSAIASFGSAMPSPVEMPPTVASTVVSAAPIPDAVHSPTAELPVSMIREIEVRTKAPLHPIVVNGLRMCMFGFLGQLVAVTLGAVAAAPLAGGMLVGIILGFGGDRVWAWGRYVFYKCFVEETITTKKVAPTPLAA